ncbi:MAG: undecaprenyldiphospho-muramoylpentapeptide beta-N-acetylglucosaminyltransferase [Candidatus Moranbacteria bacterium]|nr:undecaprenyldiphospho-muramoylpentapeptide beta-N-acetylglucosaminyltransferase [Candidatus Moranbacteria bacterium]
MRIVLTSGGTGGHIFPLVAVSKKLREIVPEGADLEFLFLGPDNALEREAMDGELIPRKKILSGKMRRYFSLSYIPDLVKIPLGIAQSLWQLLVFMPDVVFSKGGYAAVPVVIAAWIYHIPIIIHESDVTPGLANQLAARLADKIAVSFPGAANFFNPGKVVITGNPIREELAMGNKEEAQKIFGLSGDKKIILVMGGSQGAKIINEAILNILPQLLKEYEIIHITGEGEYEEVIGQAGREGIKAGVGGYHPYPFLRGEMAQAFAASDLIISRAGANSLTEISAVGKPAIIIPIRFSANNHQELNAYVLSESGAAIVLAQDNLGGNMLLEEIEKVTNSHELQFDLSERIKKLYVPGAVKNIAEEIIKLANE